MSAEHKPQRMPDPAIRALAHLDAEKARTTQMLAVAMHEAVCGSWEAGGFQVREGFLLAGEAARQALAEQGWDMFAFPDGGWGLVT